MKMKLAEYIVEALKNSPIGKSYPLPLIEKEYLVSAAYNETTVAVIMPESLVEFTSAVARDCLYSSEDDPDEKFNLLMAIAKLRTASRGSYTVLY